MKEWGIAVFDEGVFQPWDDVEGLDTHGFVASFAYSFEPLIGSEVFFPRLLFPLANTAF